MPSLNQQDEKIAREILKVSYNQFEDVQYHGVTGEDLYEELDEFDQDHVAYVAERIDEEYAEVRGAIGQRVSTIQISPTGIEKLQKDGYETILESDMRYELLKKLYQIDRENAGLVFAGRDELIGELGDEPIVDQNIWYLKEKRLVETHGGGGGLFYHSANITDRGIDRFESYRQDGVGIPRTRTHQSLRQASIGPNESEKAENLFRDIVELSQEELIVIDRYAREGLYDLLQHVPQGVDIKVMTSNTVTGDDYQNLVNQFSQQHSDIEVRSLSNSNWDFHDRYVIRDREDGWAWGHSFHDAGDTQHTASELRPINRESIVSQFTDAWKNGSGIV
ncbi:hypothetical protein [Halococcus thailandensis]|uniref:Uncharacterized protein n=1 Tax=Halococcus thailandensis JCM 13552 TaxID=1227457 RepID=M0NBS4_9EURY|nr:hypothetical protein [Halococcus thailandensis]EMA55003.1 hypothetical protein C451_05830 [Halococcus thailandensis JCM 13552]